MRLSDIQAHTITTTITISGESVEVVLRPSSFTSEFESRVRSAESALDLAELLSSVIVRIDITEPDDNGNETPIRCDGETFNRLIPIGILRDLWAVIGDVLRPGEAQAGTSNAG